MLVKFKLLVLAGIIGSLVGLFRKNPPVNLQSNLSIHQSIYQNNPQSIVIESNSAKFTVNYVENACLNSLNPYFPAIHIATDSDHDAWVQVIYTKDFFKADQVFIDASLDNYPFYTYDQDFYDAPHYTYSLSQKPINVWRAQVYAVKLDHNKNIISCVGGIEWGFKLSFLNFKPQMIKLRALSVDDWQKDYAKIYPDLVIS